MLELSRPWFWTLFGLGMIYAGALFWVGVGRKRRAALTSLLLIIPVAVSRLVLRVMHRRMDRLHDGP